MTTNWMRKVKGVLKSLANKRVAVMVLICVAASLLRSLWLYDGEKPSMLVSLLLGGVEPTVV